MAQAPREDETPAPPGPTGSRRVAPAAGLLLTALILVGLAASALRLVRDGAADEPEDALFQVPDWRPGEEERAALAALAVQRREAAPPPSSEDAEGLAKAYTRFNRVDFGAQGDPRSRDLADAHADYRQWALSALRVLGPEPYMGMGQRLSDDFMRALARQDGDLLERLGGTFVTHLRATGLVDPVLSPQEGARWVIPVAFVTRWAQVVRDEAPTATLVSPEERLLMLRWKLAANPLVRHGRRLEIAEQLRRLGSDYPVAEALAARAAHEGLWREAARLYRDVLERRPDDSRLRAAAEHAAARAR